MWFEQGLSPFYGYPTETSFETFPERSENEVVFVIIGRYLVFEAEVCSTLDQELHNLKVTFLCSIKHSTPTWGLERRNNSTYHDDGQLCIRSLWNCLGAPLRVCNKHSKLVTLRFSRKHVKRLVLIYTRKWIVYTHEALSTVDLEIFVS